MLPCAVCREAYFVTADARNRHQTICLALSNFYTPSSSLQPSAGPSGQIAAHSGGSVDANPARHDTSPAPRKRKASTKISTLSEKLQRLQNSQAASTTPAAAPPAAASSAVPKAVPPAAPPAAAPAAASLAVPSSASVPAAAAAAAAAGPSSAGPSSAAAAAAAAAAATDNGLPTLRYELKKALANARDYIIKNKDGSFIDLVPFVETALQTVKEILTSELDISRTLKFNMVLEAEYEHPDQGLRVNRNFKTRSRMLFAETDDLDEQLRSDGAKLLKEEEDADAEKSGWIFLNVHSLTLRVSKFTYKEPRGSSYLPLPSKIAKRRACVNVDNKNNKCFVYAVLCKHIPHVQYDSKLSEESFDNLLNTYNFDGLSFPVTVNQIKLFEKNNQNVSINVFEINSDNKVAPLRIVDELADHIDLLLLHSRHDVSHYVYIQDFNKLIQKQISKSTNKLVVCKRCSHSNETRKCKPNPDTWLKEHLKLCGKHRPTEVKLPTSENNTLQFVHYETQIKVPIIVCADFESTLLPISTSNSDDGPFDGKTYQSHQANSFCTLVTSTYDSDLLEKYNICTKPFLYRGKNAGAKFLLHLKGLAEKVSNMYALKEPITISDDERKRHDEAVVCELCNRAFSDLNQDTIKCQDHDHITSKFRYSLCSRCNLRAKVPNFIPVWLHNMSNYDQAFIISNLNVLKGCEVRAIPSNKEKMISIMVRIGDIWLRFLDSYRMMAASLDELVKNLPVEELIESSKLVPREHQALICRKGIYCYDYVTNEDKFLETCLPPKSAFANKLNETDISEEDYAHARHVWNCLKFETLGQYHDFYLRLDVCLLTDVLNSFRSICYKNFKLDVCHFWTAPSLSWQAMLRHTGITLELLSDYDMYLLIESSIRGGIVQSNLRYAKSNNKLLERPADYNPEEPTSYLLYLDAVNLYGYAMSTYIPTSNFKWEDRPETVDWTNLPPDSPFGYILECDIDVPESVHDKLNDLPPLPEKAIPPNGLVEKLLTTLNKKTRYVAHYRVLQQAQKLGLRITKIHRVLKFSQSAWMQKYIMHNSKLRSEATDDFSRNFFKLLNNAVFGKSLQNNRRHMDVRVVTSRESFNKYARNSNFVDRTIIKESGDNDEDGVILVFLRKDTVLLNKPIYIGSVTLDQSKEHMYNFFYNVLYPCFKSPLSRLYLVYLDTDGLVLLIITEENLQDILKSIAKEHLDLSNYPLGHALKDDTNKQVAGKFKDETKGRALYEHIGLRSKMYCQRFNSAPVTDDTRKNETKKAKGVKSSYVDKKMRFEHYRDALFNRTEYKARFNLIQCKKFKLTSVSIEKRSLSFNDDKRYILEDGIHTLAHGHYKITEHRRQCGSQSQGGSQV